jgi:ADP-ribose pyrophosphatase
MKDSQNNHELMWSEIENIEEKNEIIFTVKKVKSKAYDGTMGTFIKVSPADWVTVIPELNENEFIMVRQYRHGSAALTDEFPAGVIDRGENPIDAARRELREETGYEAQEMIPLGKINPNPAFMTNTSYTFLARGLTLMGEQELDEHERIKSFPVSKSYIEENMGLDKLNSAIMVQAWFWYIKLKKG